MRQNAELTKIKARIRALSEKTLENGCSEAEAMTAAEMVGRLLDLYSLTMDEVDLRDEACVTHRIARDGVSAIDFVIVAIASFCEVKVWASSDVQPSGRARRTAVSFFGHESDVQMAVYLYNVVERAIDQELAAFKRSETYKATSRRRAASSSFAHGMTGRLSARLREMKEERDAAVEANRSTGRSLIVLKGNLVEEEFRKMKLRLTTKKSRATIRNSSAYSQGSEAGNRVNLSRPVNQGGSAKMIASR